jgi:predicted GTPase
MTNLERLIKAHVEAAPVTTISGATERIAEEMARELLKDEGFRAEMQSLVRRHFTATMQELGRAGGNGTRRRTRSR